MHVLIYELKILYFSDEDEDDVDDEEHFVYDIAYDIPNGSGATMTLLLNSTTPYNTFLNKVAKKMKVTVTHLANLAYIPSFLPKSPKPQPKLLDEEQAYCLMIRAIDEQVDKWMNPSKGQGKMRAFSVKLFDMLPAGVEAVEPKKKTTKVISIHQFLMSLTYLTVP
jgi:hypothetical protein